MGCMLKHRLELSACAIITQENLGGGPAKHLAGCIVLSPVSGHHDLAPGSAYMTHIMYTPVVHFSGSNIVSQAGRLLWW